MEMIIHRKANFGHGLCGAQTTVENSSLHDDKVSCSKCKALLVETSSFNENSRSRAERRNQE